MLLQAALVALGATLTAAVPALTVEGSRFVNGDTGDEFQVVGMAYQIGGSAGYDPSHGKDPLSNGEVCRRDAALLQVLGVNTIRVYNLDPDLNHDECASVFNKAGMYMLIDVNSPLVGESINSESPWESYYAAYLNRTFAIVDNFKNYPNTLGFFSGNEVISSVEQGGTAPPYIRAVTRDLKNYIKKHADRSIPVGYSAADVRDVLEDSWNYFQCSIEGEDDDISRADMFALNSYSWCGNSSFTEAGYDQLVAMFKTTSVPVFYSEFGCNKPSPRVFTEIQSIYGSDMMGVFSGGVVYEFAQESNNYGLATVNDDGSVELLDDYNTLKEQYAKVDWTSVQGVKSTSTSATPPTCSSSLIKEDGFSSNFTLPDVPPGAQDIIDNGVGALVGKIIDIDDYSFSYGIKGADGSTVSVEVSPLSDDSTNVAGSNNGSSSSTGSSGTNNTENAAFRLGGSAAAVALPVVLAGFMATF
ncbi:putative Glucanosyltransferase-domain-containing protein [Seiridium unicorne]|uniref:1,3-beta-glucanosyltransferase n=1 Tax=Seiridium unicorne TaxID=138068 RepID=A0ABR2VDA3_9PEZI